MMDAPVRLTELVSAAMEYHPDPMMIVDKGRHAVYCNQAMLGLFHRDEEAVYGKRVDTLFSLFGEEAGGQLVSLVDGFFDERRHDALSKEYILESDGRRNGIVEVRVKPISMDDRQPQKQAENGLLIFRDITSQWDLNNELYYHATHDSLTGLLNRHEFEHKLAEFMQHGNQTGVKHSLCFIDLNKFKKINDQHGHITGDNLLRDLSQYLMSRLRKGDVLGRIGGDEFGLILGGCSGRDAVRILKDIQCDLASKKFEYDGEVFRITASIGLIDIGQEIRPIRELIHMADFACYKAKNNGGDEGGVIYLTATAK